MKKRGFTLVELLAVIVILAIILAIAIPGISGIIDSVTKSAFAGDAKMVLKQLDYEKLKNEDFDVTTVTLDSISDYGLSDVNYSELNVGLVDDKPYIVIIGTNKWDGLKVCGTMHSMQVVLASDTSTCEKIVYTDYASAEGINQPKLQDAMIPVMWNGTNWVKADTTNENATYEWYSYTTTDKKWANSVTVNTANRATYLSASIGTVIPMTDINAIWVWIPRYAYQIATNYHTNTAGTINIKFLIDDTNETIDETAIAETPAYSGSTQTNYIAHPAFTFGTTELKGLWVAKFEMSGTTTFLNSKPGVDPLASLTLVNMFNASRNMEISDKYGWELANGLNADGTFTTDTNNIDTHIMKNIEYGAAAYLAQSAYGKDGVSINPNSDYYTGGGSGNAYITNVNQSTTGTIYGIYDMSGGFWEYVMGNLNNTAGSSELTPSSINNKYIDRYTSYSNNTFGDAIYEISGLSTSSNSWYGNYSVFPTTKPWFIRSGCYFLNSKAGIYDFASDTGGEDSSRSWRTTLLVDEGL